LELANARSTREPTIWTLASEAQRDVLLLGVPQTYPPPQVNGVAVSCFLTPKGVPYTYPAAFQSEVEAVVPGYVFDVEGFRTDDKDALLQRIYDKTRKHFRLASHLLATRRWDLFMMVEMGPDRLHHAFWHFCDPSDPRYDPQHHFASAMLDYYRFLDAEIGHLLELIGDDTAVLVVSDHGAKRMEGAIAINDWLRETGYLVLLEDVAEPTQMKAGMVDWSRTKAWGEGGYCGRIFINVAEREPCGIVAAAEYEELREELISQVRSLCRADGRRLVSTAHRPEELYREVRGIAPDLVVYFGDLAWRAIGSVGHDSVFQHGNDTGPDGANHDWDGIFILRPAGPRTAGRRISGCNILDVAPTILHYLGLDVPGDMPGRVVDASPTMGMTRAKSDVVALERDAARSC